MKLTKADFITITRVLLLPVVVALILLDYRDIATIAYFLAALTDGIDGRVARRYKEFSEHGGLLDALNDRIFLITIFVVLALLGSFKVWIITACILGGIAELALGVYISRKTKKLYLHYVHRDSIKAFAVLMYLYFGLHIAGFVYADYVFIAALILGVYSFIDYLTYAVKELK
ncbi:CDP-alcohol phosphatidyltransferase family protein [Candidatus Woesearchaeota archaeon]|nr:CDP-alcohol phosphatidyltransferase family protein [Candidatus Woesearchaeota archaeon]